MLAIIQQAILYSSPFASLLPLWQSWRHEKNYPPSLRVLHLHLLVVNVFSLAGTVLWYLHINNLPLLHVYTLLECSLVSWFYSLVLTRWKWKQYLVYWVSAFAVFVLVNACCWQSWFRFNTYPRTVESMAVIVLSILCYFQLLDETPEQRRTANPFFWINTGFFLYFCVAFTLFSLSNFLLGMSHGLNLLAWTIHAFFSILLYLFIFIGLCCYKKK